MRRRLTRTWRCLAWAWRGLPCTWCCFTCTRRRFTGTRRCLAWAWRRLAGAWRCLAGMRGPSRAVDLARTCRCRNRGLAAVHRGAKVTLLRRRLHMLCLQSGRPRMAFTRCRLVRRTRASGDAVRPVEAGAGARVATGHRPVVGILYMHVAEIVGGAIVGIFIAVPLATLIPRAAVAVAVIDPAVIADMAAPIAVVEHVDAIAPAPIARRPKHADRGWQHPGAGHPVVIAVAIRPIAGGPHVTQLRHRRLHVNRQHRRRHGDGNANIDLSHRGGKWHHDHRRRQNGCRKTKRAHGSFLTNK